MSYKVWEVRTTSYFEGSDEAYAQTTITVGTRAEARVLMAAQKTLAKHAILRTEVELFSVKIVPMGEDNITKFYTRKR